MPSDPYSPQPDDRAAQDEAFSRAFAPPSPQADPPYGAPLQNPYAPLQNPYAPPSPFQDAVPPFGAPQDVADLISRVLSLRTYEFRLNGIDLVTDFERNLPQLVADGSQLQQALLELGFARASITAYRVSAIPDVIDTPDRAWQSCYVEAVK